MLVQRCTAGHISAGFVDLQILTMIRDSVVSLEALALYAEEYAKGLAEARKGVLEERVSTIFEDSEASESHRRTHRCNCRSGPLHEQRRFLPSVTVTQKRETSARKDLRLYYADSSSGCSPGGHRFIPARHRDLIVACRRRAIQGR